jgi:hypothetical protein
LVPRSYWLQKDRPRILRARVFGDGEVFRTKASHIVPLVISHGHIELNQDDVYAEMHRVVLGGNRKWKDHAGKAKYSLRYAMHVAQASELHNFHLQWRISL